MTQSTTPGRYTRILFITILTITLTATAAAGSVTAHSPADGEQVSQSPTVFEFTYSGAAPAAACGVYKAGTQNSAGFTEAQNDTRTTITADIPPGPLKYNVRCDLNGDKSIDIRSSNITYTQVFHVDDQAHYTNTSSSYTINGTTIESAFIGHDLLLSNAGNVGGNTVNVTAPNGSLITRVTNWQGELLSTDNASLTGDGRYAVWDEDRNVRIPIELFEPTDDVIMRYSTVNTSLSNPSVTFYAWKNGSTYSENVSTHSTIDGASGAGVVRANISQDLYWIGINSDNTAEQVVASNGALSRETKVEPPTPPRINDAVLRPGSNISGYLSNATFSGFSGHQVTLDRYIGLESYAGRTPYITGPPSMQTMTNDSGYYTFTDVPTGKYSLGVTNNTVAIVNRTPIMFAEEVSSGTNIAQVPSAGTDTTHNITATTDNGNVSLNLSAKDTQDHHYATLITDPNGSVGTFTTLRPGQTNITLEKGQYGVDVVKFDYTSSKTRPSFDFQQTSTNLSTGGTDFLDIGFETTYTLTGTVTDESANPVPDARVAAVNQSNEEFHFGRTTSNGTFSITVPDGQYRLEARPPLQKQYKDLRRNSTGITVSSGPVQQDIVLGPGTTLTGQVTDSDDNGIKAYIEVYNRSTESFSYGETNKTGHYNLNGLEDIPYRMEVHPADGALPSKRTTVDLGAVTSRNISITGSNTATITGTITNTTGGHPKAQVLIKDREGNSDGTVTNNSGEYEFTDLPKDRHYRIKVRPQEDGYGTTGGGTYLTEDTTQDFVVEQVQALEGHINDGSGDPVSGAYIWAWNRTTKSFSSDQTDPNGGYSLELPGNDHRVQVYPGRDSSLQPRQENVSAEYITNTSEYNVSLVSGTYLTGSVTKDGQASNFSGRISVWNESQQAFGFAEFTGGTYNITGLKNGQYSLWIDVENQSFDSQRKHGIVVSPGGSNENINFGGQKTGRKIGVIVQDTGGDRVANASVYMKNSELRTNSDGVVTFPRQDSGKQLTITAEKPDYAGSQKTITTKSKSTSFGQKDWQNVTLTINNTQGIEVTMTVNLTAQGTGKAESDASILVMENNTNDPSDNSAVQRSGVTGSNGKTTIDGLIEGDYFIATTFSGGNVGTNTTTLTNGTTGRIEITEPGATTYDLWYRVN